MSVLSRINLKDAKSAKNSAKKNSFQAAKDLRVSSTEDKEISLRSPRISVNLRVSVVKPSPPGN